jgi:hypothetical protein
MNEHGILYLIWQGNTGVGRLFTLLLLALGGAAAWIALRHAHRYRLVETAALDAVRAALVRERQKMQGEGEEGDGTKPEGAEADEEQDVAVAVLLRSPRAPRLRVRPSLKARVHDRLASLV